LFGFGKDSAVHDRVSLRKVAEGHRTGEGDMIGMRLFSETEQLRNEGTVSLPLHLYLFFAIPVIMRS
jgi:hypothetical protein